MAAILLSAGSNVAFWDEQTLSKNSTYQKCNPPGILNCGSHWNSVVFSGTNETLACAEKRGDGVKILSLSKESGVVLALNCKKDNADYTCCDFLVGKNRYIVTGGSEGGRGVCDLWDMKSQSVVKSYSGYSSPVSSISTHPCLSQMLSGCVDGSILLHSVSHSQPVKVLKEGSTPDEAVNDIVFSPFEQALVTSCHADGSITFWSVDSQRRLAHFPGAHGGAASRVCFSPYNKMLLASCGTDGKFVFYDILQRKTLSKTKLPCPLFSLCLLHDGTTMVGGGGDGKLHVYDLRNCSSPKDTIPAHTSPVYCLVLPRSSSARRRRSSKSAKSSSTPSLHSRESSVVAPPPPTAHFTPQTTVNSNTTATHSLDKESPSIGRLAGGGDSIFSPLMQGAPSMSESRISDIMHDNTLGKAHSLPQRLSGSGSEHKAPSYPPKKLEEVTKEESVQSSFHVPVPHQFPSSSPFGRNYGEVGSLPGRANFHSTAVHVDTTPSAAMRFGEDIFSPVQTLPDSSDPVPTPTTVSRPQVGAGDEHPGNVREAGDEQTRGVAVDQWTPMDSTERTASPRQSNSKTVHPVVNHVPTLDSKIPEPGGTSVHQSPLSSAPHSLKTSREPDTNQPTPSSVMPLQDGQPPNILIDMIQSKIDDSMEDLRLGFNRELLHLYSDILRQLAMQEKKIENAFSRMESLLSENQQLQNENKILKDENKRLKTYY